jgi:hypothetical protein
MKDAKHQKEVNTIGKQGLEAIRDILISLLGLNLAPIPDGTDEKGEPKYRWPGEGEYTPMLFAIARPDYASTVSEAVKTLIPQEFDDQPVQDFSEDDLEFFDELQADPKTAFWNSDEMIQQRKAYIKEDASIPATKPTRVKIEIDDDT